MKPPVATGEALRFDQQVHATCPFCDGTWKAGEFENGVQAVLHNEPACETFLELESVAFMARARLAGSKVLS